MDDNNSSSTDFLKAIENNDLEFVRRFLRDQTIYDLRDFINLMNKGLSVAVQVGSLIIIQELFNSPKRPNLHTSDEDGRVPLHHAVALGHLDIVNYFIRMGACVNCSDNRGYRPLHVAAKFGHTDIMGSLTSAGAHVYSSRTSDSGFTPLHVAIENKQMGAVAALIDSGLIHVDVKTRSQFQSITPLHTAVKCEFLEGVRVLCKHGANLNSQDGDGIRPIHLAARADDKEILLFLLEKGVDVDSEDESGRRPIHYAAYAKKADNAKVLDSYKADIHSPDTNGYTPLYSAVLVQATDVVSLLLLRGVQPDFQAQPVHRDNPLLVAASGGNVQIVEMLLKAGADPKTRGTSGATALHRCQRMKSGDNRDRLIKFLLAAGAELNVYDKDGCTPLHSCVFQTVYDNFSLSTLSLLVQAGASLHPCRKSDEHGSEQKIKNSPLCWLVWRGYFEAARYLLSCDWDVRDELWMNLPGKSEEHTSVNTVMQQMAQSVLPLANICRKVIRNQLLACSKGRQILTNILKLPLPTSMKEFVSLQV